MDVASSQAPIPDVGRCSDVVVRELCHRDQRGFMEVLGNMCTVEPVDDWHFSHTCYQRKQQGITTFVAVNKTTSEVLGTASVSMQWRFTRGGCQYAQIHSVVVRPEHRRQNVGRQLITHCIRYASSVPSCFKITVQTASMSASAFYAACGLPLTGLGCGHELRLQNAV